MAITLGLSAARVDAARALLLKSGRREQARFAVEGPTMLAEAFRAGLRPLEIFATQAKANDAWDLVRPYDDRLFIVPDKAMARLSDLETPPGLVAIFPLAAGDLAGILATGEPAAVLAGVADPGNAGTLVRTAEIFGIPAAIFVGEAVEPHNPKVVRATMGAFFRMRVATATATDLVRLARAAGYTIVAAANGGTPLPSYRFPQRALIAIGNERRGVASALPEYDEEIAVPQIGSGESLNASIAGGIIFYTFSQQSERRILRGQTLEKP